MPAQPGLLDSYWIDIHLCEPVSREREAELVRKARNGDGVALHDLITANLRFVVTVANEFRGSGCPMNELISDGNAGLAEAARRFDETRGLKFITYAAWWIRQSIRRSLSRRRRIVVAPSNRVADLRKVDSAREETSVTTIFESVERCLGSLDSRERGIIRRYYGFDHCEPMTLEEIGNTLGLTRERIRQLRDLGLTKLRARFGEILLELSRN